MTSTTPTASDDDISWMTRAVDGAATARLRTSPNPWVGCVVVTVDGQVFEGATEPPGQRHAERVALDAAHDAGVSTVGATVYTTLEPCSHHGRTPPCADAIVGAGVARGVCGVVDPDPAVAGRGLDRLRAAGIEIATDVLAEVVAAQLKPYLHHRRTGRPFVVVKTASTLDGRTTAADGSSMWITGDAARTEVHRLRAESDAILVGSATVRADDPSLTVRHVGGTDPQRVVLGTAPAGARVHPCLEWTGSLTALLDHLGSEGVLQLLVEGGARVSASFHRERLVDRYVVHLAPAFMGGDDGRPVLSGFGAPSIADLWRGRIVSTRLLGDDLEVVVEPSTEEDTP